jgi:hypothetical protein
MKHNVIAAAREIRERMRSLSVLSLEDVAQRAA